MMRATFHEEFHHDRRPKQAIAFVVQPGTQNMPRDVVEAAIAAGKATAVDPPGMKRPIKAKKTTTTQAA